MNTGTTNPIDSDFDCFTSKFDYVNYIYSGLGLTYYENTGTASAPNFVERLGSSNPLDSANYVLNDIQSGSSFVDIDNDGDLDVFISHRVVTQTVPPQDRILYYENTGTATNPVFLRNENADPFSFYVGGNSIPGSIQFIRYR